MFLYYKFNKLSLNGTHLKLVKLNINNNFKRIKLFKMSDEMKTGVTVIDYSERTITLDNIAKRVIRLVQTYTGKSEYGNSFFLFLE